MVGVASEKYGEEVGAFIVLKDGASLDEQAVVDFCRGTDSQAQNTQYIFLWTNSP